MLRVMTIVGTRPELIRLSLTIEKLDRFCDHRLVHTGQNYDFELNEIFFRDLGIRAPDRSEEHTSELQSLMRISYAVFCLKKKKHTSSKLEHQAKITLLTFTLKKRSYQLLSTTIVTNR